MQHLPATELKVEQNDQNSLCSYTGKNKMAAIGSGARAAAVFDWNDGHRKRKLFVILMMMIADEAPVMLKRIIWCRQWLLRRVKNEEHGVGYRRYARFQ